MILRPYQLSAIQGVNDALAEHSSSLVVMATGTGKTTVGGCLIQSRGRDALWLAHREELVFQAADRFEEILGEQPDIEMGDSRADLDPFKRKRVVCGTIQSQVAGTPPRMERFRPGRFKDIYTDEAHHARASTYQKVYDYYCVGETKHIGFTATPDRADEKALGKVYESVGFVYELSDAILDGWLVDPWLKVFHVTGLDYSGVRETAGDLNQEDVARQQASEAVLRKMVLPIIEQAKGRRTVIFATPGSNGRTHGDEYHIATRMAEIFNDEVPNSCRRVHGEMDRLERRQIIAAHKAGEFPYLLNVGVLTEGYDDPGIEVVAITRPTKSRSLYAQMVGRGTRPLPGLVDDIPEPDRRRYVIEASTKPRLEVLDFRGNAGKHSLAGVADILGGKYDDEVVERAARVEDGSILDALEEGMEKLEEERERRRRIPLTCKVSYLFQTVDPFEVLDIEPPNIRGWDIGRGPTERMKRALEANGVVVRPDMTIKEAKLILDDINLRARKGLVGYRQAVLLRAKGLPTEVTPGEALNMLREVRSYA